MGLGLQKFFMIFLIAMAFISLDFHCSNAGGGIEIAEAVNPNCFMECSFTFGNAECLADCISRKFNSGSCQPDKICCCNL
ncbi:hypothetical protein CsatB_006986 [Cannabis sativa]